MLDTETIKNISTFVEITMQVEERLRGKYDFEVERLTEELDMVRDERDALTSECYEYEKRTGNLEAQVEDLTGQKDRQAAKITELKEQLTAQLDIRDRQKTLIDDLEKEADSLSRELEAKQGPYPATDEELQKKLDKAMDHIRRQGEEIDKMRAGAADPRWIPLRNRRPDMNENVLACTKRGTIYIAQETDEGWKNSTGKMAEPVAWMPLPAKFTGREA